ncbi:unnamed protein product [Amoebophrya sp. A25]|nr:unnamed protein product [Amoebophrya sp. A25]|eukprot:GSA25T00020229001.1
MEEFKIEVYVRMRPIPASAMQDSTPDNVVTLPLHQKVALLKQQHPGLRHEEALKAIIRERGRVPLADTSDGSAFGEKSLCANSRGVSGNAASSTSSTDPGATGSTETGGEAGSNPDGLECSAAASSSGVNQDSDRDLEPSGGSSSSGERSDDRVKVKAQILHATAQNVLAVVPGVGLREFAFDGVFHQSAQQADVYGGQIREIVADFLNGENASIICYGQTAAGKTYTSFGPPELHFVNSRALEGLAPRACREVLAGMVQKENAFNRNANSLFQTTSSSSEQPGEKTSHSKRNRVNVNMSLLVSYVEVYGNEVNDLLSSGQIVGQSRDGRYADTRATDRVGHRYVLDGNVAVPIANMDDLEKLLLEGDQAKRRAATAMNERSTRAHTILVLELTHSLTRRSSSPGFPEEEIGRHASRLFIADLGGAERLSKSKAAEAVKAPVTVVGGEEVQRATWAEYYEARKRVQETLLINRGLLALKRVIAALNDRVRLQDPTMHVPYDDSMLTKILRQSLGGDSRTCIVCCCSLEHCNAFESVQTLRFAESCSHVAVQKIRKDGTAAVKRALMEVEGEIESVKAQIEQKEEWKTVRVERTDLDTVAGEFGRWWDRTEKTEFVNKVVVTGAEKERELLETLLQRQQELTKLSGPMDNCPIFPTGSMRQDSKTSSHSGAGSTTNSSSFAGATSTNRTRRQQIVHVEAPDTARSSDTGTSGGIELRTSGAAWHSRGSNLSAQLGSASCSSSSTLGRDFRDMIYRSDADKGRRDFRQTTKFDPRGGRMKARDFEDLTVVADGLRFLFRKTPFATECCGETTESCAVPFKPVDVGEEQHPQYLSLAERLKKGYEVERASGETTTTFGRHAMKRLLEWMAVKSGRDATVRALHRELPPLDEEPAEEVKQDA